MKTDAHSVLKSLSPRKRLPRVILNDDTVTLRTAPPPHTVDSIDHALNHLKGTDVDCLCWCVGEVLAYAWPSRVIENIYDMYDKGFRQAAEWASIERDVMYSLHKQSIDYLPFLIERAHKRGIMFVASFRLNDTHVKSYPISVLTPDFWRDHQHCRIWGVTHAKGYYNAALDYSFPEVRKHYQDAIVEVASTYDVDGIELDFTRTPYFFNPDEAWAKRSILTRFVRGIRNRLATIGKKRGKPIALLLRVPSRPRVLHDGGIDLAAWIDEGLPTLLVMSELVINLNHRLEPWLSRCRRAGIPFYPSIEGSPAYNRVEFYSTHVQNPIAPRHDGWALATTRDQELQMLNAAAQNFLAQKPDGVYLFNFVNRVTEGKNEMHTDRKTYDRVMSTLKHIGNAGRLGAAPKYYSYFQDLPIYVEANRPRQFHQTIEFDMRGPNIRRSTMTFTFRQVAEKNPHADGNYEQDSIVPRKLLRYYLNDKPIPEKSLKVTRAPAGRVGSGFTLPNHQSVTVTLPGTWFVNGTNFLQFEMPKPPDERDPYVYIYDLEARNF